MSRPPHFPTPEDVENAFYEALNRGDLEALVALWAEDEEVRCIHPTGMRLNDINQIRESWRSIFSSTQLRVHAEILTHWQGMLLAVHLLSETLFIGDNPRAQGKLHVTHVFARGPHGWRMLSRHASTANEGPQTNADSGARTLH